MSPQKSWEEEVIELVGDVISFWGFKENHGKIWALLYIQNQCLSTSEIRQHLNLSKGAMSMLLTDLESWRIITRECLEERERKYVANDDFFQMVVNVIKHREAGIVSQSIQTLKEIEDKAKQKHASPQDLTRLSQMHEFALLMKQLLLLGSSIKHGSIQQMSTNIHLISKVLQ
jgi:HTH-type transcriptional regulator, glycine betaine synthesis regulator